MILCLARRADAGVGLVLRLVQEDAGEMDAGGCVVRVASEGLVQAGDGGARALTGCEAPLCELDPHVSAACVELLGLGDRTAGLLEIVGATERGGANEPEALEEACGFASPERAACLERRGGDLRAGCSEARCLLGWCVGCAERRDAGVVG